ncbi:Plakophilin-4 [Chelonia mydas]|uniref:Plakophilin-4 n=1 Tax=Chelonia mydas TaxID=8469 RepID=M7BND4_CHEMY|nr:Plakophilin-4 [Chelonia mydas]
MTISITVPDASTESPNFHMGSKHCPPTAYGASFQIIIRVRIPPHHQGGLLVAIMSAGRVRSVGNSRSSTQMNSYSDSGYQEVSSFHNSQNLGKSENRQQHSLTGTTSNHLVRNSRAEGQTLVQPSVSIAANRVMRRVSSVPSRAQSPSYVISTGVSPSRGSLRTSVGSGYGSPSVTESRPLTSSAYSSTTLPVQRATSPYTTQRPASPAAVRRISSVTSRQAANPSGGTSQYQASVRVGSPLALTDAQTGVASPSQAQMGSSSPKRTGMTAVPQHLGTTLQRTIHDIDQYGQQYDIYERMVPPRPDSLTGLRSSYASQNSQLGQELRSAISPDLHITPIYEGRTYYSPVYRSPNHGAVELHQGSQTALYRTGSGFENEEFAWRDPELPEVIHMLQHQFPSVQANAAAYLQHLCFGDNKVKIEVCRLGGIKHLVDLLDHRVLEVQKNACGALRNLVYGKSTDENKIAMKNVGGIPALLRLLRKSIDAEIRELVTDTEQRLKKAFVQENSDVWNLSSAGEEARKQMRSCEGLVDSLLYVIHTCVNTSDYDSKWDGVGPIPGFSKSPKGVEMLWHPSVVKPYLTLLAESSNPATLEGSAGSLQNLSAGNWKFAAYIRAAVRKEKGLPILVELLRMDNDRVVSSVATALRNMALDVRNKELIGKYAMRDLVNRLPGGNGPSILSDETVAAICCALHEVTSKNMENAKALADTGGIEKLVGQHTWAYESSSSVVGAGVLINLLELQAFYNAGHAFLDHTGLNGYNDTTTMHYVNKSSLKVVKAAAQVLNTLWQYRDLRSIYKKDGWNQNHFITPVSTLERDRFKSHPSLSTTNQQMSPIIQSVGSTSSSPALLGIREPRSEYNRTQPSMQYYNSQGDVVTHKDIYTGSSKPSPIYISSYSSPAREQNRRLQHQQLYYSQDDSNRKNYDAYRLYLQSPHSYEDPYFDDRVHFPATTDYMTQYGLKSTTNYVDFYSTRRPSYRAEQYPGSPDSWV